MNLWRLTSAHHAPGHTTISVLTFLSIWLLASHLNVLFHLVFHVKVMSFRRPCLTRVAFKNSCNSGSLPFSTLQLTVLLIQIQLISGPESISEKKRKIQPKSGNLLIVKNIPI